MLDFVIFSDCSNIFVYERSTIVAHNLVRNPKTAEDVLFDEIGYSWPYRSFKRNSFHPLRKIFGGDKDPNVAIRWLMDGADKIKPPGVERP